MPLRGFLNSHTVMTVYEMGWSRTRNGDLLRLAAQQMFEVFFITDQNLKHQQNITARHIAIVVLPTTSWPVIQKHTAKIAAVLESIAPGDFIEIDLAINPALGNIFSVPRRFTSIRAWTV